MGKERLNNQYYRLNNSMMTDQNFTFNPKTAFTSEIVKLQAHLIHLLAKNQKQPSLENKETIEAMKSQLAELKNKMKRFDYYII